MKPIRLSDHALRYTTKRGFTISEVEETIRTSPWMPAELGRLDCRKNFPYRKEWNGRVYATKQVRPIFIEETAVPQAESTGAQIVVIKVYTYYFDQP